MVGVSACLSDCTCPNNYLPNVDGECNPICSEGYSLDVKSNTCVTCAEKFFDNCEFCNKTDCLSCLEDYYLDENGWKCLERAICETFDEETDLCI